MTKPINEIVAHLRAACENPSVKATLIQTEDLLALCEAVESPMGGLSAAPVTPSPYVLACLETKPEWKEPPFEYSAVHFLVGAGLIGGNLDGNIRGLTTLLKKQYDTGVKHGSEATEFAPA